jgi:cytochrome b6-f complex iron-sulfur subunit
VTDFPLASVTTKELPVTFNDPDPAAIGSETPGVITQVPVATLSSITIFVVRDTTGNFLALYSRDPYRGCSISWVEANQQFEDPCHGSQYSRTGVWLRGPSPRNLDSFGVIISAPGEVMVDIGKYQMGQPHP